MLEKVISYISSYQNIPLEKVTGDAHLVRDLGMSSIDIIQLVCRAEEEFGVEFDENRFYELLIVEKIALYIEGAILEG